MSEAKLILVGAGGHSHACIDVIETQGEYQIIGLVGLQDETGMRHFGYPVIATDTDLPRLAGLYRYALITVGQITSPKTRIRLYQQAARLDFTLPRIISPTAHISKHASIGAGTIVMHGAIVNAGARVGQNCIINSTALVEHDAVIDDHCHISTGAILNGKVSIGAGSFVGSGCVIKDGISIGKNCIVGLGLSVREDQADNSKFLGHKNT